MKRSLKEFSTVMPGFGFSEALGQVPVTAHCEETHVQCAMGTPARRAFDELDLKLRQQVDANAVSLASLAGQSALPALSISSTPAKTCESTSCCSSRPAGSPPNGLDVSSVVCEVDASVARGVFYDFARQDNHPRIQVYPSSLEWKSVYTLPGAKHGELSAVCSYDAEDGRQGLEFHAEIEPVESVSRIELDYDVQRKQLESTLEISHGETVGRVETRRDRLRRATLKTTHERFAAVSGSVSSLVYSEDRNVKVELFKRKHARGERDGSGDPTGLPRSRGGGLALSVPTMRVDVAGDRVKELAFKQWFWGDQMDVHVAMKRASTDTGEVKVGMGTCFWDLNVRSIRYDGSDWGREVPRIDFKTKGAIGYEVGYDDGKVQLGVGGSPGSSDAKVKVKMEYAAAGHTGAANGGISCYAGFYLPL